ncbi:MAG: hypothetical protein ABIL40_11000 [candidate division WOR-3 bacterium]
MGKVMFFAFVSFVVLVSLCFGQEGLLKTEAEPSLMYSYRLHSEVGQENFQLQPLSFYASYKRPHFNSFITNTLIMQAEGESLQPKTPFGKQAGIYGLEFLGGSAGTLLSGLFAMVVGCPGVDLEDLSLWRMGISYIIGNMLLTSTGTWIIGKLVGQNNSWRKASVGAGIGTFAGITFAYLMTRRFTEDSDIGLGLAIGCPTLGAVIGFNLK